MKREILDAVERWYQYDWLAIENNDVVPAEAGTHFRWIPALAGMTRLLWHLGFPFPVRRQSAGEVDALSDQGVVRPEARRSAEWLVASIWQTRQTHDDCDSEEPAGDEESRSGSKVRRARSFAALRMTRRFGLSASCSGSAGGCERLPVHHCFAFLPPIHPSLKSFQSRFCDSIRAIFFLRSQPLICFSRAIAARTSPTTSK